MCCVPTTKTISISHLPLPPSPNKMFTRLLFPPPLGYTHSAQDLLLTALGGHSWTGSGDHTCGAKEQTWVGCMQGSHYNCLCLNWVILDTLISYRLVIHSRLAGILNISTPSFFHVKAKLFKITFQSSTKSII